VERTLRRPYETVLRIRDGENGELSFEGEQDLGKMAGGVYRYEGTVVEDTFQAIFRAENGDHGVMAMSRVD
jgi:hypothetical protein